MTEQYIFCIYCNSIVPIAASGRVFQTGYYKVKYRLGQCRDCMEPHQETHCDILQESNLQVDLGS